MLSLIVINPSIHMKLVTLLPGHNNVPLCYMRWCLMHAWYQQFLSESVTVFWSCSPLVLIQVKEWDDSGFNNVMYIMSTGSQLVKNFPTVCLLSAVCCSAGVRFYQSYKYRLLKIFIYSTNTVYRLWKL